VEPVRKMRWFAVAILPALDIQFMYWNM
jgi:hypothetical protein